MTTNVFDNGSFKESLGSYVYHNGEWIEFGKSGPEAAPTIITSVLTQDEVDAYRFTDNNFTTTITATESPNKLNFQAEVVGALSIEAATDVFNIVSEDGKTLTMASDSNLTNGLFEVGDLVKQDSSNIFSSSTVDTVGLDVDNVTTYYWIRSDIGGSFDFSAYDDNAQITSIIFRQGQTGPGGNNATAGIGGGQGVMYHLSDTVANYPSFTFNSVDGGWQSTNGTPSVPANTDGNPGTLPPSDLADKFADYFRIEARNGGSKAAGYGTSTPGGGGCGGVAFTKVSNPTFVVNQAGSSNDNLLFSIPNGNEGNQIVNPPNGANTLSSGKNGWGGSGYGGGGGGGGSARYDGNAGWGPGGMSSPGALPFVQIAAVTGRIFVQDAVTFTDSADLESLNVGDTFVASNGAEGTVLQIELDSSAVILNITNGVITSGITIDFTADPGKGTIFSITETDPVLLTINPLTEGRFYPGHHLVQQTPQPIRITPVSEAIDTVVGNVITFDGPDQLLNFANGDAVTMCDADGNPATVTYESSQIIDVSAAPNDVYYVWDRSLGTPINLQDIRLRGTMTAAGSTVPSNHTLYFVFDGSYQAGDKVFGAQWCGSFNATVSNMIFKEDGTSIPYYTNENWNPNDQKYVSFVNYTNGMTIQSLNIPGNIVCYFNTINSIDYTTIPLVIEDATNSAKILTFSDGTDLDKFPDGTVVQGELLSTITSAPEQPAFPVSNIFDSDKTKYFTSSDVDNPKILFNFGDNLKGLASDASFTLKTGTTNAGLVKINGGTQGTLTIGGEYEGELNGGIFSCPPYNQIETLELITNNGTLTVFYLEINGVIVEEAVTVTDDSDIGNNKLTVSGGEWGGYKTSQDWSSSTVITNGLDFQGSQPLTNAYDTSPTTYAEPRLAGRLIFSAIAALQNVTSGSIALAMTKYGGASTVTVNADTDNIVLDLPDVGASSPGPNISLPITSLSTIDFTIVTGNSDQLWGIYLNGVQLADGPWNQDQLWSNALYTTGSISDAPTTTTKAFQALYPPTLPFNGNSNRGSYETYPITALQAVVFRPATPITGVNKLELFMNGTYATTAGYNNDTAVITSNNASQWRVLYEGAPITLNYLWNYNASTCAFAGVRINNVMLADPGIGGDKEISISNSGSGTVDTVDAPNNQITLSANNTEWIADYHMTTPEKNAVEMKAYLKFDQAGNVDSATSVAQPPVLMTEVVQPQLKFPTLFGTGETPDTDLPYPTYLQTTASAGNIIGFSPEVKSKTLYPQTTSSYTIPANSSRIMKDEFGEFCKWACSFDYRAAQNTVNNVTITVEEHKQNALDKAQAYIDNI